MRFDVGVIIVIVAFSGGVGDGPLFSPPAALAWSTSTFPLQQRRQHPAIYPKLTTTQDIVAFNSLLRSQPFDDADEASIDNEETDDIVVEQQRRRKRDILRRTLGLSTSSSSGDVKKLNTDKFLSRPPNNKNNNNNNNDDDDPPIVFRSPGQIHNPDLLSPDEISQLNSKYDAMKRITEEITLLEILNDSNTDEEGISIVNNNINAATITPEEARRIVDYTVDEERLAEIRSLDERKKQELIQQWEMEGISVENKIDADLEVKAEAVERAIEKDGVVREIIREEERQLSMEEVASQQKNELEMYERSLMAKVENDDDDDGGDTTFAADSFDDVYETAIDQIQKSRSTKLGPRTLGIMANSFALEEGKEYIRNSKREKEFLMEVEKELALYFKETKGRGGSGGGGDVIVSDEDVASFFRSPVTLAEERMYRSIVRQIADKRAPDQREQPQLQQKQQFEEEGEVDDDDDDDIPSNVKDNDDDSMTSKYKLSPKETVEAYKLLNLWREVESMQDSMEVSLGMKDDEETKRMTQLTNKIEPFFLYEEDSEEKRLKEKESLNIALRKVLESDDNAEISSNELLMQELLEGRVTKDKLVRLLEKVSTKATDKTLKDSLVELKTLILEGKADADDGTTMDEAYAGVFFKKRRKKSGQPLDLSGVFRTSDMGEEKEPKAPVFSSSASTKPRRTMPSWVDKEYSPPDASSTSSSTTDGGFDEVEDETPPPPNTPFFQSLNDEDEDTLSSERSPTGGMFGTMEEQRLRKLAKRVGAQTDEEMEELRRNMEGKKNKRTFVISAFYAHTHRCLNCFHFRFVDLKAAEMMRDAQLNYDDNFDLGGIDLSSLNLNDENDDQIMSILGKRPTRASSSTSSSLGQKKVVVEIDESEEPEGIFVDAEGHLRKMESGGKERDIAADIFRAKTAGRYTDEETRGADEAAFRDFLKWEEEAERSVELLDSEAPSESVDIDIDEYAGKYWFILMNLHVCQRGLVHHSYIISRLLAYRRYHVRDGTTSSATCKT